MERGTGERSSVFILTEASMTVGVFYFLADEALESNTDEALESNADEALESNTNAIIA